MIGIFGNVIEGYAVHGPRALGSSAPFRALPIIPGARAISETLSVALGMLWPTPATGALANLQIGGVVAASGAGALYDSSPLWTVLTTGAITAVIDLHAAARLDLDRALREFDQLDAARRDAQRLRVINQRIIVAVGRSPQRRDDDILIAYLAAREEAVASMAARGDASDTALARATAQRRAAERAAAAGVLALKPRRMQIAVPRLSGSACGTNRQLNGKRRQRGAANAWI